MIVMDLDFTLWHRPRFRAGPPFTKIDDGLAGVRSASGEKLDLYPGARRALIRCANENIPVAFASRTHRPAWALEWMRMLRIDSERNVESVVSPWPVVIRDGSKVTHLREIHHRTDIAFESMLFFDDNLRDVTNVEQLGCTTVHCGGGRGITDALFDEGLARWDARSSTHEPPAEEERLPVRGRRRN